MEPPCLPSSSVPLGPGPRPDLKFARKPLPNPSIRSRDSACVLDDSDCSAKHRTSDEWWGFFKSINFPKKSNKSIFIIISGLHQYPSRPAQSECTPPATHWQKYTKRCNAAPVKRLLLRCINMIWSIWRIETFSYSLIEDLRESHLLKGLFDWKKTGSISEFDNCLFFSISGTNC